MDLVRIWHQCSEVDGPAKPSRWSNPIMATNLVMTTNLVMAPCTCRESHLFAYMQPMTFYVHASVPHCHNSVMVLMSHGSVASYAHTWQFCLALYSMANKAPNQMEQQEPEPTPPSESVAMVERAPNQLEQKEHGPTTAMVEGAPNRTEQEQHGPTTPPGLPAAFPCKDSRVAEGARIKNEECGHDWASMSSSQTNQEPPKQTVKQTSPWGAYHPHHLATPPTLSPAEKALNAERAKQGLHKTQICEHWAGVRYGYCRSGEQCRYAHGLAELDVPMEDCRGNWAYTWAKGDVDICFWHGFSPSNYSRHRFRRTFLWERGVREKQVPNWAWGYAVQLNIIPRGHVPPWVPFDFDWPRLRRAWETGRRGAPGCFVAVRDVLDHPTRPLGISHSLPVPTPLSVPTTPPAGRDMFMEQFDASTTEVGEVCPHRPGSSADPKPGVLPMHENASNSVPMQGSPSMVEAFEESGAPKPEKAAPEERAFLKEEAPNQDEASAEGSSGLPMQQDSSSNAPMQGALGIQEALGQSDTPKQKQTTSPEESGAPNREGALVWGSGGRRMQGEASGSAPMQGSPSMDEAVEKSGALKPEKAALEESGISPLKKATSEKSESPKQGHASDNISMQEEASDNNLMQEEASDNIPMQDVQGEEEALSGKAHIKPGEHDEVDLDEGERLFFGNAPVLAWDHEDADLKAGSTQDEPHPGKAPAFLWPEFSEEEEEIPMEVKKTPMEDKAPPEEARKRSKSNKNKIMLSTM